MGQNREGHGGAGAPAWAGSDDLLDVTVRPLIPETERGASGISGGSETFLEIRGLRLPGDFGAQLTYIFSFQYKLEKEFK